ncbi:topoisomerase IV [Hydrogenoanaerobacterium sp.]|uniref:topoisomerase IV n=1 Tax=Hydrogenoanaerobacterium sp. TaxID=2953763 RepID=UPI0028A1A3C5|nr:topoisomerase IV [Hydrogenoanaerobacterium sp.]
MDCFLITALPIIALALIVGGVVFLRKKSNSNGNNAISTEHTDSVNSEALVTAGGVQDGEITIPIELLPVSTQIDEKSLFEITDSTVVARISELIPFTSQTGTRMMANNALNSLKGTELIKMDIPFSRLTKSKDVVDAARGYVHGGRGVAAQANLTKVDMTKVTKATTVANGVANVMNVGSLVVGQYYMSEISSKLETMTKSIDKIGDFQDREFKSRILSVITLVGEISQFSSEIMGNDGQRTLKLSTLENLKATATELLGQVNITISDITQKCPNPNYENYQSKVEDFKVLVEYQNVLVAVLAEISKLTYLLGKGSISTERSYVAYSKYLGQARQTRTLLGQWHDKQVTALHIDLSKERITKAGIEAVVSAIPGLFDDKYKYNELSQSFVNKISTQVQAIPESSAKPKEVYDADVEIIIKGDKYYYLHDAAGSSQQTTE